MAEGSFINNEKHQQKSLLLDKVIPILGAIQ